MLNFDDHDVVEAQLVVAVIAGVIISKPVDESNDAVGDEVSTGLLLVVVAD